MPYPPPPGPPTLGIFQAIGKVQEIPDPAGHTGEFLETDGVITKWEPVGGGALPDQTGHAGEFLTTDGVNASWAAVAGGGVLTVGPVTTPTANAAIIVGNAIELAQADVTNPGILDSSLAPQTLGGEKLFIDGASSYVFDIRNYGAVSAASSNVAGDALVDCYPAIQAAIADWTQQNVYFATLGFAGPVGSIYIPTGNWYISRPLVLPNGCSLTGDGYLQSLLIAGRGDSVTQPTLVPAFAGPMIYVTGPTDGAVPFPTYTSPLVGAVGQAMVMTAIDPVTGANSPSIWLSDCYPFSYFANYVCQACSLRFWVHVTSMRSQGSYPRYSAIMGSRGPDVSQIELGQDQFIGVYVVDDGTDKFFRAYFTTRNEGLLSLDSTPITLGNTFNVELNYDGSFFGLWVDGVFQDRIAATGPAKKMGWECVSIGVSGPEFLGGIDCITGAIDSIEFAQVARHTGTGDFTPPAAKYTADANTLLLINWDQGDTSADNQPFVIGQVACPASLGFPNVGGSVFPITGMQPFYMRFNTSLQTLRNTGNLQLRDFQIQCNQTTSGIISCQGIRVLGERLAISLSCGYGIKVTDGPSFYWVLRDIWISQCSGIGLAYLGHAYDIQTTGCEIGGLYLTGGVIRHSDDNALNAQYAFVFGLNGSQFTSMYIQGCNNDAEAGDESTYVDFRAAVLVAPQSYQGMTFVGNTFDGSAPNKPPIIYTGYFGGPLQGITHVGDDFVINQNEPGYAIVRQGSLTGSIQLINCTNPFNYFNYPWSNVSGWVVDQKPKQLNNQTGLSITDTQANNLAGTFTIMAGYTSGGPIFSVAEPNDKYEVWITPKGYVGSAPAPGSTRIVGYTTSTDGFTATVEADPGGTCLLTFSWVLVRSFGTPALYEYLPTNPDSFTNPMVSVTAGSNFAAGMTIVPNGRNTLPANLTFPYNQFLVDAGDPPGTTDFWGIFLYQQSAPAYSINTITNPLPTAWVVNGKLHSLLSPGAHNLVLSQRDGLVHFYMDGGPFLIGGQAPVTQQTPVYVGERTGGADPVTAPVTFRNLKVDENVDLVITNEPDSRPAAGTPVSLFIGDQMTMGLFSTGGSGGFATQIAEARFPGKYYHIAAVDGSFSVGGYASSLIPTFWNGFGGQQSLESVCIFAGFNDILNGATATATWDYLLQALDGVKAAGTFVVPIIATPAWVVYRPPTSGTAQYTINGHTKTATFMGSDPATSAAIVSDINSDGTINTVVSAKLWYGIYVEVDAVTPGAGGNNIPVSSDNTNGSYFWPQEYTALGKDSLVTISSVTLACNFDTDIATTANNLVSDINGDATLGPLVTASNVSDNVFVEANTAGYAGNSINISSNANGGCHWVLPTGRFGSLTGGVDGAVAKGINPIVLVNAPPFGDAPGYTAGKNTERLAFNVLMAAYAAANPGQVFLADAETTLWDPLDHTKIDPALLGGDSVNPNDAGHTALFGLIDPLLP